MVGNIGYFPWGYGFGNCCTRMSYQLPLRIFSIGYPRNYASAVGMISSNRRTLEIYYESLTENLNSLLQTISTRGNNYKLTEDEKAEYDAIKAKVLELQRKTIDYGRHSSNILVFNATDKIKAYTNEYYKLRDTEAALNAKTTERMRRTTEASNTPESTETPESSTTPEVTAPEVTTPEVTTPEVTTPEVTTPEVTTPEVTTPEVTTPEDTNENVDDGVTIDELKSKYEKELKPSLEEMIADPDISAEDKKKLEDKKKELEDAIAANKTPEEIQKIYGELSELMVEIINRIGAAKENRKQQEYITLIQNSSELIRTITDYNKENRSYTEKEDRKKLVDKMLNLQYAIDNKQPFEEIKKLYDELNTLFKTIKSNTTKLIAEADSICGDILSGSLGVDWDWPWNKKETENEKKIKDAVKKINKNNIRYVLNRWDEIYKSSTSDTCLLETIYGEFKVFTDARKEITDTIAKAIEGYAKAKGAYEKVSGHLQIIKGNGKNSDKYNAFNRIIAELNKMA